MREEMTTTCLTVKRSVLVGLRKLALLKAQQSGGRISVSGVVEDLAVKAIDKVERRSQRSQTDA